MGWFWGPANEDPVKHLDPRLKEFLRKETPEQYIPPESPPEPPPSSLSKVVPPSPAQLAEPTPGSEAPEAPPVPPESLYQDGRYAHLWKNYVPMRDIVASQNTDKMRVVIDMHKERQANLSRAALENCAEEHQLVSTCFSTGGLRARMTMCKKENTQFGRCYDMQTKFLRALGYASMANQDSQVAERIQMHADTLYHRMLDYETAVKEAKTRGLPQPEYQSVFFSESQNASLFPPDPNNRYQKIPPQMLHKIQKPLEKMSPAEQEVEVRALAGEMRVIGSYTDDLESVFIAEKLAKQKRKEKMAAWLGEWAASWLM